MFFKNAVEASRHILEFKLKSGMTVIDATVGNGHDSLLIKELIGPHGHLIGFDPDERAIEVTKNRLHLAGYHDYITLYTLSHSEIHHFITEPIDAVVFNLGYLPGQSKRHITQSDSTLMAIEQSLDLLLVGGFVIVVVYPGHVEGQKECLVLQQWCKSLDQKRFHLFELTYPNQINHPPYLIYIERRSL